MAKSGRKHSAVAADAGITAVSLSRILRGKCGKPGFLTIAGIARAAGVPVGWVLEERGFDPSPRQLGEIESSLLCLLEAIGCAESNALLRLRRIVAVEPLAAGCPPTPSEVTDEYLWRRMILAVRREEYRERIAKLRPLLRVFRNGRLFVHGNGGVFFIHTPDREELYVGGAHDEEAHAIAAAVNLVLDLCAQS